MSEQHWTTTPIAVPQPSEFRHEAVVDGLMVRVVEDVGCTNWTVEGWLADVHVFGANYHGWRRSVDAAKAQATQAAHRLYAAGVRGTKSFAVSCCERVFATRDAADQHEEEHLVGLAVAAVEHDRDADAEAMLAGAPAEDEEEAE